MKKLIISAVLGFLGLVGSAQAGGSFSITLPLGGGYTSYAPPVMVQQSPQMCWNGYYNTWQPCVQQYAPAPVYAPPPVVYYNSYPGYSGYGHSRHHSHGHRGYQGYPGGSVSFSYRH